jgi:hypothetical protein
VDVTFNDFIKNWANQNVEAVKEDRRTCKEINYGPHLDAQRRQLGLSWAESDEYESGTQGNNAATHPSIPKVYVPDEY